MSILFTCLHLVSPIALALIMLRNKSGNRKAFRVGEKFKLKQMKNLKFGIHHRLMMIVFLMVLSSGSNLLMAQKSNTKGITNAQITKAQQIRNSIDSGEVYITSDIQSIFLTDGEPEGECPAATSGQFFPMNGCHVFTVELSLEIFTIGTSVQICCACAVCIPSGNNIEGLPSGTSEVNLSKSNTVQHGEYNISIAKGRYAVDRNGQLKNLKYKVTKS